MDWKIEAEGCAAIGVVFRVKDSTVLACDLVRNRQPKSGAGFLGCEEWIENFVEVIRRDPTALIPHFQNRALAVTSRNKNHLAAIGHSLDCIDCKIQQHLFNLLRIAGTSPYAVKATGRPRWPACWMYYES